MNMQIGHKTVPLKAGFGVEILGVDLATASDEELAAVRSTFEAHGAIVLRNQKLDPKAQLRFTSVFGPPEVNARKEYCHPDEPKIYIISNKKDENGRPLGDAEPGLGWHTDLSYSKHPSLCTMIHALEVPPEGSDTLLADLCAAWNALPEDRQRQVDGLIIHHSYQELAAKKNITLTEEMKRDYPDVWHPLVRRHPADGRKALWVSTGTVRGITGMETNAALELINEMVAFATQEQFVYRHKWQVGDVLCWDNRCTLHRGTPFDRVNHIRHAHRTWVRGEIPV